MEEREETEERKQDFHSAHVEHNRLYPSGGRALRALITLDIRRLSLRVRGVKVDKVQVQMKRARRARPGRGSVWIDQVCVWRKNRVSFHTCGCRIELKSTYCVKNIVQGPRCEAPEWAARSCKICCLFTSHSCSFLYPSSLLKAGKLYFPNLKPNPLVPRCRKLCAQINELR